MTESNPITPPPELVEQWLSEIWHEGTPVHVALSDEHIATRAAQWGAEQARIVPVEPDQQHVADLLQAISNAYSAWGWIPIDDFACLFEEVARLAGIVEEGGDASFQPEDTIKRARDVLSRWGHTNPKFELKGPKNDQLAQTCGESLGKWKYNTELVYFLDESSDEYEPLMLMLRNVLAAWGKFRSSPVSLAERLPGSEERNIEGRCWLGNVPDDLAEAHWVLRKVEHKRPWDTYWLPYWALPIPERHEG